MKLKTFSLALFSFILISIVLTGCKKDVSGTIGLKFNTVTTAFPIINAKSTTGTIQFTSGNIVLKEIKFEVETDDDSIDVDFELEENITIDYATGQTTPDISYAQIPAGTFKKVKVKLSLQNDGTNPAIVLNGTYTDPDGIKHPLCLEYNSESKISKVPSHRLLLIHHHGLSV